ncbi:MAG: hypothetical protein VX664_08685 [Chloroflexota bacterium]|nr:hypothetical protein [Chloroflexota bacterium]
MTHNEPLRMRPRLSAQAEREVRRNTSLRQARTCYGHLAGVAGVALMDELLGLELLEEGQQPVSGNRISYELTPKGLQTMDELGVDLSATAKSNGTFAFGCLDWTERGHHLGGSLGRAVTAYLSERGLVGRTPGTREVTLWRSPRFWLT